MTGKMQRFRRRISCFVRLNQYFSTGVPREAARCSAETFQNLVL